MFCCPVSALTSDDSACSELDEFSCLVLCVSLAACWVIITTWNQSHWTFIFRQGWEWNIWAVISSRNASLWSHSSNRWNGLREYSRNLQHSRKRHLELDSSRHTHSEFASFICSQCYRAVYWSDREMTDFISLWI